MSLPNVPDSPTISTAGTSTSTHHTLNQFAVPHPPGHRRLIQEESDHEEAEDTHSESENEQEGSIADISGDDDTMETPTTRAGSRKTQFRKFLLPECELILLRALADVLPFSNKRGEATKLWEKVELYLHKYDAEQKKKKSVEPLFTDVTVRACKSRWNYIRKAHAVHRGTLQGASGITLPVTERNTLIEEIFEYENSIEKELADKKREQDRQKKRKADDRENGKLLLDQSRAGPRRRTEVSAAE
ncbi:hypothetical protein BGZ93_003696, partial [Podila epicladia]